MSDSNQNDEGPLGSLVPSLTNADLMDVSINELSGDLAKLETKMDTLEEQISDVESSLMSASDEDEKKYLRDKEKQLRDRLLTLAEEKKALREERKLLREEKAKLQQLAAAAAATGASKPAAKKPAAAKKDDTSNADTNNNNFSGESIMGARILSQFQHLTQMIQTSNLNRDTQHLQLRTYIESQFTMIHRNMAMRGGPMPMPPPRMGMGMNMMPMARFGLQGQAGNNQANGNNGKGKKNAKDNDQNGEPQKKKARRLNSGDNNPDGPKLQEYKDVASAWQEWQHGLGGYKPVKDWVPADYKAQKSTYSRRRPLWVLMAGLVEAGRNPDWVIRRIEEIYGPDIKSIRWLSVKIKEDETNGTLHEDLKV